MESDRFAAGPRDPPRDPSVRWDDEYAGRAGRVQRGWAGGPRRVVGLISGTSADAIDAALVEIRGSGDGGTVELLAAVEEPYGPLREIVMKAMETATPELLCRLNVAVGEAFALAAKKVVARAGIVLGDLAAVGSHGQTVWHAPDAAPLAGFLSSGSLQIGSPAVLAARLGAPVVSDFRSADMALGGQGAPLVPLVDWLLYRQTGRARALQNLGGIGNVTWLGPDDDLSSVVAFDTGPGNVLIDRFAFRATEGREAFDRDGVLAARGKVNPGLLDELLAEPYYARRPPKSTGRELFDTRYADRAWEAGAGWGASSCDRVATAVALTAETIRRAYRAFLPNVDEAVLSGGGARNPILVREIQERLAPTQVLTLDLIGGEIDAKEAVAFAVLADRTLQGLPGNVPSATGASGRAILGSITMPPGR